MLDRFDDLKLADYGFVYRRDLLFPQDDINWFLLEKGNLVLELAHIRLVSKSPIRPARASEDHDAVD